MRLYNTLTRREEDFAPSRDNTRPDVHVRPDGLRPRPHRQLPHVRRRRRAAPRAEVPGRLQRAAGDELHRRRRPDDPRIEEGRRAAARVHRSLHRGVPRGRRGARARSRRGEPARDRRREHRGDGRDDPRARAERPHLSERRLDLLQDLDVSRVRQAGAARSRRHQERRARRLRQVRQGGRPRLRAVEGDQAGRADVGLRASARAVPAGTSSARRWRCACSARRRSTSTPAASI